MVCLQHTILIIQVRSLKMQMELQSSSQEQSICQICCLEHDKLSSETTRPQSICYECWRQHIQTVVGQITYQAGNQIHSPVDGGASIDICHALNSLTPEHSTEIEEALFKKYSAFTPDIEKCPASECDFVFTMERCRWPGVGGAKCPKCEAMLGQQGGISLKSIMGLLYFLLMTSKCPKCDIPIEKTIGCPHMSCPCGHQFCWFCLKDYFPSSRNLYSVHEARECVAILLLKTIVVILMLGGVILTLLGADLFHDLVELLFVVLKYILHTVVLDLLITINVVMVNHVMQKVMQPSYHPLDIKWIIGALILVDVLMLMGAYYFELLWVSFIIVMVELGIAVVGALTIWGVIFTIETWFEHIC